MLLNIILIADLVLLAVVITVYFRYSLRERNLLKSQIDQGKELQRSVYQSDVLREIGERIGYSFDVAKMVEIITSSLGNLLEYDVVAYVVIKEGEEKFSYKCRINNSVSHTFLESVKQKILQSLSALLSQEYDKDVLDESITGNLVDDNQKVLLESYFNVPVFISGKLVGIILVASKEKELYPAEHAQVLYSIANQAATAISKLQAVLESEKGKLVAIINSMTDGVVMIDTQNRLVVSNPAVKQILEIESKGEVTIYDLVDALAGLVDIRTKVEQAISLHSPVVEGPVKLKNHILQLTITPVRTIAGERLGAAVVFRDITTEKDLEKLRQDFTAMMVHELRAPLTAVRWSGENILKLASGTLEPEKLKEIASNITTASKNMLELVNDLLDVAKLESGKFDLNIQEYDLANIIREQVQTYKAQAEQKHIQLNLTAPEKLVVKCDRVRVGQVLQNLLSNAIKYTEAGEVLVTLATELDRNRVIVSVKDTGMGVGRDELPQLFSKFRQLKTAESARKGTGLGLAVSKGLVEAHGGQIWAESPGENMGSIFYFSLPLDMKAS